MKYLWPLTMIAICPKSHFCHRLNSLKCSFSGIFFKKRTNKMSNIRPSTDGWMTCYVTSFIQVISGRWEGDEKISVRSGTPFTVVTSPRLLDKQASLCLLNYRRSYVAKQCNGKIASVYPQTKLNICYLL